MTFKFVHAADLHLDSPLRASADGALQSTFERATFRAFARIVDLCLSERVEFLLLAGDLFEYRDRSVRARLVLLRELERLDAAGVLTFIVHGNHDPLSSDAGTLELPPSVKVFGPAWEEVEVRREGRVLCRVQGISYPEERVCENLSSFFSRQGSEFTIGLLHANLGGTPGHANYAPCSLSGLASRGLDYWALGHVHTRAEYALEGGGVAVYPGNPQGRHAGETGERGCMLVRVRDGRSIRRFCPTDSVRWSRIQLDVTSATSLDVLIDEIEAAVDAACSPRVDAARAPPVDPVCSSPIDAARSLSVDAACSPPVDTACSSPVDAARSRSVDAACSPRVDAARSSPVDAACSPRADAARSPLVDAHAVHVVLCGAGPLHRELAHPGAIGDLVDHLRPRALQRSPPVILESIADETRPELDLGALMSSGTLGEAIRSAAQAAESDESARGDLWNEEGLAKLDSALRRLGIRRDPEPRLLERAVVRALELLYDEAGS